VPSLLTFLMAEAGQVKPGKTAKTVTAKASRK